MSLFTRLDQFLTLSNGLNGSIFTTVECSWLVDCSFNSHSAALVIFQRSRNVRIGVMFRRAHDISIETTLNVIGRIEFVDD